MPALNLTMLNGKTALTADAYIKNTNDVLLPIPYAASTGISGLSSECRTSTPIRFELAVNRRDTIGKELQHYIGTETFYRKE